jgi:dipeptidyl-peptidase-3
MGRGDSRHRLTEETGELIEDRLSMMHPILLQPRKIFVQPNTHIVDGEVQLKEYSLTAAGVIQSFVERRLHK